MSKEWLIDREKISMSERIGKLEEFKRLAELACVHVDEREVIAWCYAYQIINPKDKGFIKFLKKIAIPVLKEIGRGRWFRSELSELGLAMSYIQRASKTEDSGSVLQEE